MARQSRPVALAIVGAWRLVSFEVRIDDGEIAFPFGEDAQGVLIYTAGGRFSAQVMRRDRPKVASGDQMRSTPEEAVANFFGCVSYFGAYDLDADGGYLVHRVEGSLFPNWEGADQKRFFAFADDCLKLSTPPIRWGGGKAIAVLVWERSRSGAAARWPQSTAASPR